MGKRGSAGNPMRERFREQVREDVKAAALRQISSGGTGAVSVNAIARELGVSGPALYRYFASRDEILAELVVDAYHDLAAALADASNRGLGLSPQDRVRALADAWRAFALSQPHRYLLLFAPPIPGYDAHAEPLVDAASRAMAVGLEVFADTGGDELDRKPRSSSAPPGSGAPASQAPDVSAVANFPRQEVLTASGAGPEELQRVVSAWVRLHGFVGLEIGGNFASMGLDADALFRHEVDTLLRDLGMTGALPSGRFDVRATDSLP